MPTMKLIKSISINAPIEEVYNNVADFHNWRLWSPWLIMDADATVSVREDGKYYDWNGKQVGSGNMTVLSETNGTHIEYDLTFLKPWKSHSKVKFDLQQKGDQVIANWHMESKLPFFMFWMKKMMEVFIGMDYDRGLRMLKEVCEEGEACSSLRFDGEHHLSRIDYIGIRTECSMNDMGKKMSEDMPRLLQFVQENELEITGKPFTQYHKWAIMKNRVIYTSGIPVRKKEGITLPDGFDWGNIPETKAWAVTHIGRYHNLGNAWSAAFMYQRNKVFRVNKAIHPFEVYVNNPAETPEKELETTIYMPVR
jgi:predicted transcriptional regulator YdeE